MKSCVDRYVSEEKTRHRALLKWVRERLELADDVVESPEMGVQSPAVETVMLRALREGAGRWVKSEASASADVADAGMGLAVDGYGGEVRGGGLVGGGRAGTGAISVRVEPLAGGACSGSRGEAAIVGWICGGSSVGSCVGSGVELGLEQVELLEDLLADVGGDVAAEDADQAGGVGTDDDASDELVHLWLFGESSGVGGAVGGAVGSGEGRRGRELWGERTCGGCQGLADVVAAVAMKRTALSVVLGGGCSRVLGAFSVLRLLDIGACTFQEEILGGFPELHGQLADQVVAQGEDLGSLGGDLHRAGDRVVVRVEPDVVRVRGSLMKCVVDAAELAVMFCRVSLAEASQ